MAIPTAIRLEFVTPERAIVHEEVDELQLPGLEGYIGVLPGHAPLLAVLQTGEMWYRQGREKKFAFLSRGFAEVLPDRVSILAMVAERAEDIDMQRADAAMRRAEERLAKAAVIKDFDADRAREALIKAMQRVEIAKKSRPRA